MNHDVIDLFCGAGGTSTGLSRADFDVKVGVDKEEFAVNTFDENHEADAIQADITEMSEDRLGEYSDDLFLMSASPPCQSFSNANRHFGDGNDDPRDQLYREFVRMAGHVEPRFILMENVRGMKKIEDRVKRDFDEAGYHVDSIVLNSREYGIPQNRERLFFLGVRKDLFDIPAKAVVSKLKMEVMSRKRDEEVPLKHAFWGLRELEPKEEQLSTDVESERHGFTEDEIQETDQEPPEYVLEVNQGNLPDKVYNHKARYHNERDRKIYSLLPEGENAEHESIREIMPYKLDSFKDKYYKLDREEVSKTMTAHMSKDCNSYIHPEEDRGLTPREAARIQSFPDNYRFHGSYTKWYKQVGNAVPPMMAEKIGESFKSVHSELN